MGRDNSHDNETAAPYAYDILQTKALEGRRSPTVAEIRLWECLKGKQQGVKFRRQHVIGECIADFLCVQERLIIEVDGGYHFTDEQKEADQIRTAYLNRLGYRVIRFTNDEVIWKIDSVLSTIRKNIVFSDVNQEDN